MPLYHFISQIGETFQCGRREILRLSYPGKTIWTGPSKLVRQSDKQPASTHLTRKPENHPCRRRHRSLAARPASISASLTNLANFNCAH